MTPAQALAKLRAPAPGGEGVAAPEVPTRRASVRAAEPEALRDVAGGAEAGPLRDVAGGPEARTSRDAAGAPEAGPLREEALADRPATIADAVKIVAWLSLAAGAIHAVAMVDHFGHWWLYGVFFLALTYGQVLWGIALLRKPVTERSLRLGALANLAIVAVWLLSRTIGVPIGPDEGSPEPVGAMDAAATFDQLLLAAYVGLILRPRLRAMRGLRSLIGVHRVRIGMMVCSVSVFASLLGGHHH